MRFDLLAKDPAVIPDASGWRLAQADDAMMADVVADAVLPSPSFESVDDPLMMVCMKAGYLHAKAKGLGVHKRPDGQLVDTSEEPVCELSLLGRLGRLL